MQFKQFYLACLSHASYYLGSGDEAVIIDPQRDVDEYLAEATANRQTIKYVIETHSHADFVSGHIELAAATGAEIIYGKRANTQFPTRKVSDGDQIRIGDINLIFLETPGHTPEGITIVAQDQTNPTAPLKVFTGDTLFIGDVGRPDLIGSKGFTAIEMGGLLYDSLHQKILPLPDDSEIYPAHGAGSLCGKSLSSETWSTLGEQRKFNYALQPMSRDEFIKIVSENQIAVPMYFPKSAAKNLAGGDLLSNLPTVRELSSDEIDSFDGIILDVRKNIYYGRGHVSKSINIGLGGQFASWAGTLVPIGEKIAIIAEDKAAVDETVVRLARVGHENAIGFLLIEKYGGDLKRIEQISVETAAEKTSTDGETQFVDVRRTGEYESVRAPQTSNLPLEMLGNRLQELDATRPIMVICRGGYRSSIATGILENAGFEKIYNILGGTTAWIDAGLDTETDEVKSAVTSAAENN